MIKLLHMLIYGLLWSTITLKNVVVQIWSIFQAEFLGLFGKAPSLLEIRAAVAPLKKWKHLGLILDHTHFGPSGMLLGPSIAKLVAIARAADSPHISIFLPRQLSESEKDRLRALIVTAEDKLLPRSKHALLPARYYDSIYNTLVKEGNEALWTTRMTLMAKERKEQLSGPTTVSPTSWGISGAHLVKLTDFEHAYDKLLATPLTPRMEAGIVLGKNGADFTVQKLTFISPMDGKPAISRAAHVIQSAIEKKMLKEDEVDQSILHALLSSPEGELWPSPDLIINFTDVPSTCGYPSWHLRYAEIVNAGGLANESSAIWKQFHGALHSFSKTVQRFGK